MLLPCRTRANTGRPNLAQVSSRQVDFRLAIKAMTKPENRPAKKRGRPATGRGQTIGVRMSPEQIADIDAWISTRTEKLSRPEAIRRLALAKARVDLDSGD